MYVVVFTGGFTIVQVNIGLRAWHICHLSKDVPVNSELPGLLRGHIKIEVGWLGCHCLKADCLGGGFLSLLKDCLLSTKRANQIYTISWLAISANRHGPLPCWES